MSKPQILLLGSYHFDNPGLDSFNMETDDVLSPKRQAELQALVATLAKFQPTKIALEQAVDRAEMLNQRYQEFRDQAAQGIATERRNEIFQIGFRLAHYLNHERVFALDVHQDLDFDKFMDYAAKNGHADYLAQFQAMGQRMMQDFEERQGQSTISELLRWFNSPEALAQNHAMYIDMLKIGKAPDYIGVQVVADWYARNLKIFNELLKIADEGSRILMLFGQGHIPIIRQTILDCPQLELIDPLTYL